MSGSMLSHEISVVKKRHSVIQVNGRRQHSISTKFLTLQVVGSVRKEVCTGAAKQEYRSN